MAIRRRMYAIMMDHDMHFKLSLIALTKYMFMGDKHASISGIVNDALKEYFVNHKDEIWKIYDVYKENGGWMKI